MGFTLERTTYEQLRPGDLFFWPSRDASDGGASDVNGAEDLQVRTDGSDEGGPGAGARVVRLVPTP